jgi:uncharacterized membrane protein required for colicin V production
MGIVFRYIRDEILNYYGGITDKTIGGILSILTIIAIILFMTFCIKNLVEIRKMAKERKASKRKIDKIWLDILKDTAKNKEHKNY